MHHDDFKRATLNYIVQVCIRTLNFFAGDQIKDISLLAYRDTSGFSYSSREEAIVVEW